MSQEQLHLVAGELRTVNMIVTAVTKSPCPEAVTAYNQPPGPQILTGDRDRE